MPRFEGFDVTGVPADGYYSPTEQYWLVRPKDDWAVRDNGRWLEIGGPGVDGISWALKRGENGVFAYYPIENLFLWKAKDVESLLVGWRDGDITV